MVKYPMYGLGFGDAKEVVVVDLKASKKRIKGGVLWSAAVLLALAVAYPAWAVVFAAKNSVITKSIAKSAVTSAKIKNRTIVNADISAAAAIAASKINAAGLNADTVDGKHAADFIAKTGDQSMSGALTAQNLNYGTTKTGYFTIAGPGLQPIDDTLLFSKATNYIYDRTGGKRWYTAPLVLPHGVTVTEIRAQILDNQADDVTVKIERGAADGTGSDLASVTSAGSSSFWREIKTNSISNPVVDNSSFGYTLWAWLNGNGPNNHKLSLVTIVYTYTTPGD